MIKNSFYITSCFCCFLLLGCKTRIDEKGNQPIVTAQNTGLIGDKIIGFSINPKDSSNWLLPCSDRSYITYNKGVDWEEIKPAHENVINYPEFDSEGAVLMFDKGAIYRKAMGTQAWKSYSLPDSLRVDLLKTGPSELIYWLIDKRDPEIHYISYQLDFSDIVPMNKDKLGSLKYRHWKYQFDLYNDSSYVLINGGHLLYKEDSSEIAKKRMNGIEKAYIEMLIPDKDSINKVFAIQIGIYNMEALVQYFLYESRNFGASWQLIDSAQSMRQILRQPVLEKNYKAYQSELYQNPRETIFNHYQIQLNDSLVLARKNEALLILNNQSADTIWLSKDKQLVSEIGKFQFEDYQFSVIAQLSQDKIELLYAVKSGGIKKAAFELTTKAKSH